MTFKSRETSFFKFNFLFPRGIAFLLLALVPLPSALADPGALIQDLTLSISRYSQLKTDLEVLEILLAKAHLIQNSVTFQAFIQNKPNAQMKLNVNSLLDNFQRENENRLKRIHAPSLQANLEYVVKSLIVTRKKVLELNTQKSLKHLLNLKRNSKPTAKEQEEVLHLLSTPFRILEQAVLEAEENLRESASKIVLNSIEAAHLTKEPIPLEMKNSIQQLLDKSGPLVQRRTSATFESQHRNAELPLKLDEMTAEVFQTVLNQHFFKERENHLTVELEVPREGLMNLIGSRLRHSLENYLFTAFTLFEEESLKHTWRKRDLPRPNILLQGDIPELHPYGELSYFCFNLQIRLDIRLGNHLLIEERAVFKSKTAYNNGELRVDSILEEELSELFESILPRLKQKLDSLEEKMPSLLEEIKRDEKTLLSKSTLITNPTVAITALDNLDLEQKEMKAPSEAVETEENYWEGRLTMGNTTEKTPEDGNPHYSAISSIDTAALLSTFQ